MHTHTCTHDNAVHVIDDPTATHLLVATATQQHLLIMILIIIIIAVVIIAIIIIMIIIYPFATNAADALVPT